MEEKPCQGIRIVFRRAAKERGALSENEGATQVKYRGESEADLNEAE